MNTWGYLILITALLLLAGIMLYARFASRSREKSLHHSPIEWVFSPEAISVAPFTLPLPYPGKEEAIASETVVRVDRFSNVEEVTRDRGYFDELQEAAAGLAKLMRSSPVIRTEPVVFAQDLELDDQEWQGNEIEIEVADGKVEPPLTFLSEIGEVEVVSWVEGEPEAYASDEIADVKIEAIDASEIPAEAEPSIEESPLEEVPPRILTLREIVGESVADQFDRLDEGLDALELLVGGIESSLRALGELERTEFELGATPSPIKESVAAAA